MLFFKILGKMCDGFEIYTYVLMDNHDGWFKERFGTEIASQNMIPLCVVGWH